MKKWGLVVTLIYGVIVVGLLAPACFLLFAKSWPSASDFATFFRAWGLYVVAGVFILAQFALLGMSVDTTQRRMRSRTPVVISALVTGLFLMLVTAVVILCCLIVVLGEDAGIERVKNWFALVGLFVIPWIVWGVLFYRMNRKADDPVTRAVAWLFRGSVLELLVAVPSHVIVRRRNDCCAPMVTGFGIASGIAIMLLSFGPSVVLLFRNRIERYRRPELVKK